MKENFPVTQREYELAENDILVSTTDLQGRITHCNHVFEASSGFSYDELIGQPHNLLRHPEMPPETYASNGATIGLGRPRTGSGKKRLNSRDSNW